MKITIADVRYNWCSQSGPLDVALCFRHALSQAGNWDTHIGDDHLSARPICFGCPEAFVPGLPKASTLFGLRRPHEFTAAELARDLVEPFRLLDDPGLRPVKLDEEHRGLRQSKLRVGVVYPDFDLVEQF